MTKKSGIVVDDWKLPVFRRRLTEAGFTYSDKGEFTAGTTVLTVDFEESDFTKLKGVLEASQAECRRQRAN